MHLPSTGPILILLLVLNYSVGDEGADCEGPGVSSDRVTINALLELHQSADCHKSTEQISRFSLNLALAAEYIINLMNSNGSELAVPGITYNLDVDDVCNSQTLAAREAAVSLPESIWTQNKYCSSSNVSPDTSLQIGFLGPGFSSNVPQVATFLGDLDIPLITPSATFAEFSDKTKYPSLMRTTVSDIIQSKAIVDFMRNMKWSYVMLIHSDDSYGMQGAEEVLKEAKQSPTICFSSVVPVKSGQESSYYQMIAQKIVDDDATAIVYFGHEAEGSSIVRTYMEHQSTNNIKYMLASDGISESQEVLRVFQSSRKRNLELVTISSYFDSNQLTSFMDYKKQRLNSALNHRNTSNLDPYIHDYMSWCSSHPSCNSSQVIQDLINTIDYTLDMMHATIAITSAFQRVHQSLCGSEQGVCNGLLESSRFYAEMLAQVRIGKINITVGNLDFDFEFDANGDKRVKQNMPVYKLSGLKLSQNRYTYSEIGRYSIGAAWTITESPANFGGSRCAKSCEKCVPERPPYIYSHRSSDYIVVATGPTSKRKDEHHCYDAISDSGFLRMEAFYFAMEHVRRLTEIDFSTLFIDTCYAPIKTHVILNQIFGDSNFTHLVDTDGIEHNISINNIVIVIGDQGSDISLALQNYLSLYKIPQISYGSSSPYLSDDVRYPYFLRTVPPDDKQAMFMIKLVQKLGLKEVGVIHQLDTIYALNGGKLVLDSARELGVCVTFYRGFTENNVSELADDIINVGSKGLPKALILFAGEFEVMELLEKLKQLDQNSFRQRGHFFIGSDTWGDTNTLTIGKEEIVYGSLTFSFSTDVFDWTVNGENQFKKYVSEQTPVNNKHNPLFTRFWQQHFNCYLENEYVSQSMTSCNESCRIGVSSSSCNAASPLFFDDVYSKNIFLAAMSFSYAVRQRKIESSCPNGVSCQTALGTLEARLRLFQLLLQTKVPTRIDSTIPEYLPYQQNGDGKITYIVNNIRKSENPNTNQASAAYFRAYKIEEDKFNEIRKPVFYIGGTFHYAESIATEYCHSCQCLFGSGLNNSVIDDSDANTLNYSLQINQKILIAVLILVAVICMVSFMILLSLCCMMRKVASLKDSPSGFTNGNTQGQPLEMEETAQGRNVSIHRNVFDNSDSLVDGSALRTRNENNYTIVDRHDRQLSPPQPANLALVPSTSVRASTASNTTYEFVYPNSQSTVTQENPVGSTSLPSAVPPIRMAAAKFA